LSILDGFIDGFLASFIHGFMDGIWHGCMDSIPLGFFKQVVTIFLTLIPNLIVFYETPRQQMTTDWLDVLKLFLIFATDTCALYVSIIVRLGGVHKRLGAFYKSSRHGLQTLHPSVIHTLPEMQSLPRASGFAEG
jgi:hypothetical protein